MTSKSKTPEQIRSEWVEKTQNARQQKQYQSMIASCSEADRKSVELLEQIDIASGGQIDRLLAVYRSIKVNSK